MDHSRTVERRASVDEVVDFVEGAIRQERLREDIRALFGWLSELDSLEVASELAILSHARIAVAQAIKEERRGAAKLNSQAPRVTLWANEAAPEPAHAPPPGRPFPDSACQRARREPEVGADGGAERRAQLGGLVTQELRAQSPTVMAQADVDRLFDSEIQTNDTEID